MLALLRRASLRRIWRALTIWRVVLQLLVLLWWDGQSWSYRNGDSPQTRAARQVSRARWLTAELLQLGSAFIKLGQLLSARPDILPPDGSSSWRPCRTACRRFPLSGCNRPLRTNLVSAVPR